MKSLVLYFLIISSPLAGPNASALSGEWKFTEIIYRGVRTPRPNPDLDLRWIFLDDTQNLLRWTRTNSPEFCERLATYRVEAGLLHQEVTAVNPKNSFECARDPDMKKGNKTANPVDVSEHEIGIHFNLGDEDIVYILTPVEPAGEFKNGEQNAKN